MKKETKVQDRNGSERIIKRNKVKIAIIVVGVLLLVTLIGVAIYFIVEATKKYDYKIDGIEMKADIDDVRNDILDNQEGEEVGIFFYQEDNTTANYLMRGKQVYDDGENGSGPLATKMSETKDHITWYGVNIDDYDYLIEELFTTSTGDKTSPYMFYEQFEYLATQDREQDIWYISNLNYSDAEDNQFDISDASSHSNPTFDVHYNTSVDKPKDYETVDVVMNDGSSSEDETNSTSWSPWEPKSGTTMLFNGTLLTSIVDGWTLPPDSDDDMSDTETSETISNTLRDIIDELIDHNNTL